MKQRIRRLFYLYAKHASFTARGYGGRRML